MISFYTFLELLCHLDEKENWGKSKGNVCKCSSVEILDDPSAIVETELHYQTQRLKNHIPESRLIPEILKCLSKSSSIDEFYKNEFFDEKGQKILIADCNKIAEDILKKEESKYLYFVEKILNCIKQEKYDINSEKNCYKIIKELLEGRVIDSAKNFTQQNNIRDKVFNLCYMYYSYIFERAKQLIINGGTTTNKNDYEDSMICLHLRLDKSFLFITNDKKMYEAIKNSIERLKKHKKSLNKDYCVFLG